MQDMPITDATISTIGTPEVREAITTLRKYKDGRASL